MSCGGCRRVIVRIRGAGAAHAWSAGNRGRRTWLRRSRGIRRRGAAQGRNHAPLALRQPRGGAAKLLPQVGDALLASCLWPRRFSCRLSRNGRPDTKRADLRDGGSRGCGGHLALFRFWRFHGGGRCKGRRVRLHNSRDSGVGREGREAADGTWRLARRFKPQRTQRAQRLWIFSLLTGFRPFLPDRQGC